MSATAPDNRPRLSPIAEYFLREYKDSLLKMPCTRETSALVDCIDFLLEAGKEEKGNGHE